MSVLFIFFTAMALSMDAFAVAVSCGITQSVKTIIVKIKLAAAFGIFQGIMPVLAYFLAKLITFELSNYTGIIAFLILSGIGIHMIRESFIKKEKCDFAQLTNKRIILLAVATSIDAFATGISFAVLNVNIWAVALQITIITLLVSLAGVFFGAKIGSYIKNKAELFGGIVLILIGLKILIEQFI